MLRSASKSHRCRQGRAEARGWVFTAEPRELLVKNVLQREAGREVPVVVISGEQIHEIVGVARENTAGQRVGQAGLLGGVRVPAADHQFVLKEPEAGCGRHLVGVDADQRLVGLKVVAAHMCVGHIDEKQICVVAGFEFHAAQLRLRDVLELGRVERIGGSLTVESKPGTGTRITASAPLRSFDEAIT